MVFTDVLPPAGPEVPEDVYGSWSASIAPDGVHVAFVSDRSGEPRVWIEGPQPNELRLVAGAPPRVALVSWSPDGDWLACLAAAAEGSRHELWVLRPDGSGARLVAGRDGTTVDLGLGPWRGWTAQGSLLVTETSGIESDCLLVDPATGHRRPLLKAPLTVLLDVDREGRRALLRVGPRGARRLDVLDLLDGGRLALGDGSGNVEVGGLTPDGSCVVAVSAAGRDLAALVRYRLPRGERAPRAQSSAPAELLAEVVADVLAERADAEVENVVLGADGVTAAVVWNVYGGTSAVSLVDVESATCVEVGPLPRSVVDDCRLVGGRRELLVTAESWSDPRGVWVIDLAGGAATPLSSRGAGELRASHGASTDSVDVDDLARPRLLRFSGHDGLELSGWLYRPPGPAPWPTLVYLHGGPESQARPVYDSLFQSLVAAGVAVFAANVRGSSGFGRAYLRADDRELRFDAIEDVASCARYLLASGVAAPGRLGCGGRSYGGYLTLAALTWFPDLFAVGVDVCGMADFATFYTHTEPWIAAAAVAEYGDPVDDAALLRELSPIHRIDALRAPLLVVHGSQDTNVPVEEAEQVVSALRERGREHRYLCFEGEGHELLHTTNRVTFVRESVAWITRHLA